MYLVSKRMEIAYAHNLTLPYESKCKNVHGHNGIVTVYCKSASLDKQTGMVIDFKIIKNLVHDYLDHGYINELIPGINPTAEAMAEWICNRINNTDFDGKFLDCICYRVDFQESEGNVASYIWDEEAIK